MKFVKAWDIIIVCKLQKVKDAKYLVANDLVYHERNMFTKETLQESKAQESAQENRVKMICRCQWINDIKYRWNKDFIDFKSSIKPSKLNKIAKGSLDKMKHSHIELFQPQVDLFSVQNRK